MPNNLLAVTLFSQGQHRQLIIKMIGDIIQDVCADIDKQTLDNELATAVCEFGILEMIKPAKDNKISAVSCEMLTHMSPQYCEQVIDSALKHFPPGNRSPNLFAEFFATRTALFGFSMASFETGKKSIFGGILARKVPLFLILSTVLLVTKNNCF